jgi:hypothetical protein
MAADSSINGQFDWLFACFMVPLQFLAAHALPASMAAYVYSMELWAKCVVQINRTFTAIVDSFHKEIIYFYEDRNNYYPFATVLRKKTHLFSGHYEWIYDVQAKQFIHNSVVDLRSHRIPYLGASLTYRIPELTDPSWRTCDVGDLSEWIADQTILAPTNELPFQVLVIAWAYCNNVSLIFDFKGYTLTVMNEDGDEIAYSLAGLDYEEDSGSDVDAPQSTSSSVSIASHENGSIQIIGERILPQTLYDLLVPSAPVNTPLPASPETVPSVLDDESCEEGEIKKDK